MSIASVNDDELDEGGNKLVSKKVLELPARNAESVLQKIVEMDARICEQDKKLIAMGGALATMTGLLTQMDGMLRTMKALSTGLGPAT